jgi:putative ABC transport system permease protein
MFIAIRDLMYAKGRFLLMGIVVSLVSFLVIMLSGLSAGLVKANISGLMALPATHIAFEYTDHPSYRNTMVERYMWEGWAGQDGVQRVEPLGHTVFNARTADDTPLEIALWGLVPDSIIEPVVARGEQLGGGVENGVIISGGLVDEGIEVGDAITLDRVLTELTVVGIMEEERAIGHLPIIYAPLRKWQEATYGPPGGPPPGESLPDIVFDFVSVVLLQLDEGVAIEALDDQNETLTLDRLGFYAASTGYESEVQSVQMIQSLLFVISAVVIGAFFSIWTIQRTNEIGLVKALGASNGYLVRDSLSQALCLIGAGTLVGMGFAVWLGFAVEGSAMPFMLEAPTLITAMITLIVAGMIGAAMSVKRITSIDPIIALGRVQ